MDAQATAFTFRSTALLIPTVIPRSLNDPVGFIPSNLTNKFLIPKPFAVLEHRCKGVPPSCIDTGVLSLIFGNSSRYLQTLRFLESNFFRNMRRSIDSMGRTTSKRFPQRGHEYRISSVPYFSPHSMHLRNSLSIVRQHAIPSVKNDVYISLFIARMSAGKICHRIV